MGCAVAVHTFLRMGVEKTVDTGDCTKAFYTCGCVCVHWQVIKLTHHLHKFAQGGKLMSLELFCTTMSNVRL